MAGKLPLSREAVSIAAKTIKDGAAAGNLSDALEICYSGFGKIACTDAAREGISAFLGLESAGEKQLNPTVLEIIENLRLSLQKIGVAILGIGIGIETLARLPPQFISV